MTLAKIITAYRRYRAVRIGVRLLLGAWHDLGGSRYPHCTQADCSGRGLAEAQTMGWAALPGVLSRLRGCGGSLLGGTWETAPCKP
jgi:hypothetical protein